MFTEYVEYDSEDYFCDDTSSISGMATLRVEHSEDYSADIGGIDGPTLDVTFIAVQVGTVRFTANQIAEMFGAAVVSRFEEFVAEYEATK